MRYNYTIDIKGQIMLYKPTITLTDLVVWWLAELTRSLNAFANRREILEAEYAAEHPAEYAEYLAEKED